MINVTLPEDAPEDVDLTEFLSVFARAEILGCIVSELEASYEKHNREPWTRHEAMAILREEFEEAWDVVKEDGPWEDLLTELLQVAMVCVRYLETEDNFWEDL